MSRTNRQFLLAKRPSGEPTAETFEDALELARLANIPPRELLTRFEELPEHKRRLLEETEAWKKG